MKRIDQRQVARNVAIHDRIARRYEANHGEIFNDVEQRRLRQTLESALAAVQTGRRPPRAFDFGSGSGNLTSHLLALGARVTAADVSRGFLDLVIERYGREGLETFQLNGRDLSEIGDGSFDLVATYSVLHHIPDYLSACRDLARITAPGGVVVIDHEPSPSSWSDPVLAEFCAKGSRTDWRKYLTPMNYVHRVRRIFDPRHSNEGDIHVWPDDHIEWDKVAEVMQQSGMQVILEDDYLLYRSLHRPEVYEQYKARCNDTRATIYRKPV